ncbi:MAG: tRNA lysidine(34) synthetase TilS [Roseibacillus sp.]
MLDRSQLSPRKNYLLAISGGRDSVCLLHQLLEYGFHKIHLVHLNHQLRGEESEADASFVEQLAKKHNLPLTLEKVEVAARAEQKGESIETSARNARHRLFAETARTTGCNRILLAHHADDQAETCLFNLLRGSSGIKGMEPETEFQVGLDKLVLLRPLLKVRRKDIDHYLEEGNIAFREDSSNQNPAHTRNRLRHEALPLLTEILQRDIVPALVNAEEISRENGRIMANFLETLQLKDPQGRLFLPKLRELDPSLQRACLEQFLRQNKVEQISKKLVNNSLQLISAEGPPKLNLPGNRFLHRKHARIFLA